MVCFGSTFVFARKVRTDAELEEELRSHVEHRAEDLQRSGLPRAEAERRARLEFGGGPRFLEECYEAIGGNFFETLVRDVRLSLRVLRKSPGFALVAAITLALAIGANAVVFGIVNGVLLRPLDVPQAGNIYATEYGDGSGWQSYPNYEDLRDQNRAFEDLAAWSFVFASLSTGGDPTPATGFATTANYFDVLRIRPYLGRFYGNADVHGPGSAPFVVLTHSYWHTHFLGDRSVLGRVVRINKHPFTVVGVAPPGFHGTLVFIAADFFMPIVNKGQIEGGGLDLRDRSYSALFESFGHLRPGVTPAQATADVNRVGAQLRKLYPKEIGRKDCRLSPVGLTSFGRPARAFLTGLMLLAGMILLAACANLGSLFAAHAADRSREVALRLALGSSRSRILRQLLTEAVVIALVGGAAGLMVGVGLLNWLTVWHPFPIAPVRLPVAPDASVYVVALSLALVSGLLFGIVPIRQVMRADPYQIIKAGPAGRFGPRLTVRDALLAFQIAICAVLVTSSLVAVRGLARSLYGNFGFDRQTMLVNVNLSTSGYTDEQAPAMQKRLVEVLETIPGVERVGWVNGWAPLLYGAGFRTNIFGEETRDLSQANATLRPFRYDVSPGYFSAAGTRLLSGRDFTWHDDKTAPAVAVVNRSLAVTMFGSAAKAIGKHFRLQDGTSIQVVGIVEDGKYMSVTEGQEPALYLPALRSPTGLAYLPVRSRRDPGELVAAIRSKLRELDPGMAYGLHTWDYHLQVVLFPSRVATLSLGTLGLMGAMLSVTGLFGMAAYSVSRRLKELGIRLALGAAARELLGAALGRAFKLLAFGSAAGMILGVLASRVLASIVYQATPRDPLVLTGVVLAMALTGLVATWIPAQRALALDPAKLLREE